MPKIFGAPDHPEWHWLSNMLSKFRKYLTDNHGAIAVETAIIAPVVIMILLPAIDIGLQIHTLQRMNKATDSGIEYVVNGGRDEAILRNIVQDSYGRQVSHKELTVTAYCGCIVAGDTGASQTLETNPDEAYYVKTASRLSDEMCPSFCDDGSEPSELVSLNMTQWVNGTMTEKQISSKMQTRLK